MFDFDNATGIISNPVYIATTGRGYSVAFSPDNNLLYVGFQTLVTASLIQYDLRVADISASAYVLDSHILIGALQLGPDGKIYTSRFDKYFLAYITNPNIVGIGCDYIQDGVLFSAGGTTLGLPNFPDNLLFFNFSLGADITLCGNTALLNAGLGWASYSWSTGATTPSITANQAGTYWVEVTTKCGTLLRDTINIYSTSKPFNIGNDTTICSGTSITIDAGGSGTNYLWSTGDITQKLTVNVSGTYWVQKTIPCGLAIDTIHVNIFAPITANMNFIPLLCQGEHTNLTLSATGGAGNLQYSLNGTYFQNSNIFTVNEGTYIVTIKDGNGCTFTTNPLNIPPPPPFSAIINTLPILCHDDLTTLTVGTNGGTAPYKYSLNGDTLQSGNIFTLSAGNYMVTIQDSNGCINKTPLSLNNPLELSVLASIKEACYDSVANLIVATRGGTGLKQYSINGNAYQFQNSFSVDSGTYNIIVKDANNCIATTTLNIPRSRSSTLYAPNAFSPNGDGNNDIFYFSGNTQEFQATIFDRWGRKIITFNSINDKWDGGNAPEGVYTYILEKLCQDGSALKIGGTVTLIR